MKLKYEILSDLILKSIIDYIDQGINVLPPERELCKIYNVSRQTVRSALKLLEDQNIIKKVCGSGAYITGILPGIYSNNIALLISEDSEYIYPSFISKLEKEFSSQGYTLSVFVTHNNSLYERNHLIHLLNFPPRGIIIEPLDNSLSPNYDIFDQLNSKNIPLVFINGFYSNVSNDVIINEDNFSGGYLSANYLLSLSHKKIAGLFLANSQKASERCFGLSRAIIESGNDFSSDDVFWYTQKDLDLLRKNNDTRFLVNLIRQSLPSYTAIVCQTDEIAYWLIKEMSLAGIVVPSDISVLSFDNSYLASFSNKTITTLTHKDISYSSQICNTLLSIIKNLPPLPKIVQWEIVPGQSCAKI